MKLTVFFGALLLAGLASSAPTIDAPTTDAPTTDAPTTDAPATDAPTTKVIVTKNYFIDAFAKYTSEHDIVNFCLPLNNLNFNDDDDDGNDSDIYLFFVEADIDDKGKKIDRGLFIMKNYNVTKLLDNGRDAAAANEDTTFVYFGAKEGLYVYDALKNKAEKYGPITDSIISIAKVNGSDVIYILTEDHILYKVTEGGTKKTKVDGVVDAQQIVLDYENNLYYYTGDKQVYVLTSEGVKKINGLPAATYVNILKPPFIIENGVPVVLDNKAYVVYVNGTIETTDFEFVVKPTAFGMEGTLVQYYAYNKKIYEYDFLNIIASEIQNEIKALLNDKTDKIQTIATRSRNDLIPDEETTTEKSQQCQPIIRY